MKVFKVSDYEWWMAETLEQAIGDFKETTGAEPEEPRELSGTEMQTLRFHDAVGEEPRAGCRSRSFATELQHRIAAGVDKPELFATTEY